MTIAVGLIGFGAWGQHHARAITECSDARLTAICAKSEATAAAAQAAYPQARIFRDWNTMLAEASLDLIDIVLPSHEHFAATHAALTADKHVLLEKPMCLNVADCQALCELAETRGKILAVGHELRMSSLWGEVKRQIDAGVIGEPMYAMIELWRKPYRLGADGWRYDLARVGSWVLEEPIHFFDLARWYFQSFGEPTRVDARANGIRADRPELHDNFSALLDFPGGKYAVISQTLAAWEHHQVAKITGTGGAILARWEGAMDRTFHPTFRLEISDATGSKRELDLNKPSGEVYELVDQVAAVVNSVQHGTPVPCTARDGYWSVAMCLAAEESIRRLQPVDLRADTL